MHLHNDLDRVFDSLAKVPEGGWHILKCKRVSMYEFGFETFLCHEGGSTVSCAPAFSPDAVEVNIISHQLG